MVIGAFAKTGFIRNSGVVDIIYNFIRKLNQIKLKKN
jgi:hypothetical protein